MEVKMVLVLGLFITIICISSSVSQNIIQPLRCLKNGEYCQNHWECCSNSCLSYVYKCVKTHNPANMRPIRPVFVPARPTLTESDLINLIFGRNSARSSSGLSQNDNPAAASRQ